jgi:hypothetical protein
MGSGFKRPDPDPGVRSLWTGIEGLDVAVGLKFVAGRVSVYELAIRHFLDLYGTRPGPFDPHSATFDDEGRRRLASAAHSFGGAAAVIGAAGLHAQAQALEARMHAFGGDEQGLRAELQVIDAALAALVTALRDRLGKSTAGGSP